MKLKTMTSIFKKISIACALIALGWGSAPHVFAQEALTYTVSPTIYDMTANPGQVFKSTLRVINPNSFEIHLYLESQDFIPKGEEGVPQFLPAGKTSGDQSTLAQWIQIDKDIVVAPEQTVEVPFVVFVPNDASPGGHFAALMVSTKQSESDLKETKVQTAQAISSLLFLRVTGNVTENSTVRSFRTTSYLLSKPEATFELRIENKGNVHVQPQGEIKIYNMWGQERGTIPINQQALFGQVLPNSVRKFAFQWSSEWSISDIGRYTAVATLAYGTDKRQFMSADTAFWIIPWKFLLLIVVVVGGFVALVTWAIKLYVRHMLRLAGVKPQNEVVVTVAEEVEITAKLKTKGRSKTVKAGTAKRYALPLEAGMLDLRDALKDKQTIKDKFEAVVSFVYRYWKFFMTAVGVLFFILLVVLFVKGALAPHRNFEVKVVDRGQVTDITPKAAEPTPVATSTTAHAASTTVILINHSGDTNLFATVKKHLEENGITVATSSTNNKTTSEEKTIVVFGKGKNEQATKVSALLKNAALTESSDDAEEQGVTIYIGKDLATDH